jgi:hypothetical protein
MTSRGLKFLLAIQLIQSKNICPDNKTLSVGSKCVGVNLLQPPEI